MKRDLIRDVFTLSSSTALSRILGLVRDIVIANKFGAGAAYDAYIIAFYVPHLLRRLLAEGALSSAFVPIFTEYLSHSREKAYRFASNTLSLALLFFPVLIALGILFAPYYIPFMADGFSPEKIKLTLNLTAIIFPFIGLIGIAAIFMGILNSYNHFFAPAFAPVLFNLGVILSVLLGASFFPAPIYALAIGVLLGGLGQLLFQAPFLKHRLNYGFILDLTDPGLKKLLAMMLPAVLGLAIFQLNVLVDNKLASRLGDGSISALQYAIRLFQLPLGVFAAAVSSAVLPRLSVAAAQADAEELAQTLRRGITLCAFMSLPAMAGLWALGKPIIQLLFEHGNFQSQDTLRTLYALNFYVPGLIGYALALVLTRAFYALQDTKTPVVIGAATVGLNILLDYALVGPMREGGLALATSIAGLFNMLLLFVLLQRSLKRDLISPIALFKMMAASALMGLVTHGFYSWLAKGISNELILVGAPVLFGIALYWAIAKYIFRQSLYS